MCLASSGVAAALAAEKANTVIIDDAKNDPLAVITDGIITPGNDIDEPVIDEEEDEEESHGDFLVLTILACLLLPIIAFCVFAIYIMRRNRQEQI